MAEVAAAFVSLAPSARGFGRKLDSEVGPDLDKSGKVGGRRFGSAFGSSLKSVLGPAIALLSIGAATSFLKGSIAEARESQKVGARTANVIKTTGGIAHISAKQVGELSTAISLKTGIDDEAIQSGANLLLTFKNVRNEVGRGNKIFDRATRAAADLSASGFGDLSGASKQLGKALNDPIKGIAALGRSGVTFTAQQKEQIKTLVTTGHTLEAQKIILKEVESQVGGAAAATATNGEKLKVAFDNFKESIGTALLPVLDKLEGFLTNRVIPGLLNLGGALKTAGGNVRDFFTQGAGHQPTVVAVDAIRDAAGKIGDGFQKSIDKLNEFKTKVGTLDLNNLDGKKIGAALSTALSDAITTVGTFGVKIVAAFGQMLQDIDWVGIGIKAGPAVLGLVLGLATGLLNGITDPHLWHDIWDHGFDIAIAVAAIAFAPSKVVGPLARIFGRIPFAGKFIEALLTGLNKGGGKLLSGVGTFFKDVVGNFFAKLFEGIPLPGAGLATRFLGFFKAIPGAVSKFFVDLGASIYLRALMAGDKIAAGLRSAIPSVLSFVASIPGRILRALGGLLRLLSPRGAEVVSGLLSGIRSRIGSVTSYAAGIPGKIKGAIKGAGSILTSVGRSIVSGLLSGIKDAWHTVTGYLSSKISALSSAAKKLLHINSPSKVFAEIGSSIGEGMALGIDRSGKMPLKSVSNMTTALTSASVVPAGARLSASDTGGSLAHPFEGLSLVGAKVEMGKDGFAHFVDGRIEYSSLVGAQDVRFG